MKRSAIFMKHIARKIRLDDHQRFIRLVAVVATVATVLMLSCVLGGEREYAAESQSAVRNPILLELFTSEGCSSCPPADEWMQRLDAAQPIPSAEIIVLSEHVDYWDHDGWKDPYSSPQATERQREYVQALGLKDSYTPQVILDGTNVVQLNDRQQTEQAFQKSDVPAVVSVKIDSVSVEGGKPGVLKGHVEVAPTTEEHHGNVYVAVALDHATTKVLAGENKGHDLSNVAIVEEIVKIGKLEKGKSFEHDFEVKLKPESDPANLRVIAFVQESSVGKVLGAAMEKDIH
ncbi:MAG TPA: DUF1223 domain-containing protein [Acidobacteriaceae bacterium]|nr:DUF1223 domain-containing protein [Acidobacteriaceae bacterium]